MKVEKPLLLALAHPGFLLILAHPELSCFQCPWMIQPILRKNNNTYEVELRPLLQLELIPCVTAALGLIKAVLLHTSNPELIAVSR